MRYLVAATIAFAVPGAAAGQGQVLFPYAQALTDGIVITHPGMLDAIMHVSPRADAKNIVIAAHLRHANGELSGEDDLGVIRTGAPLVEVQKDGVRIGILIQMRDADHRVIGALGLMYPYKPGDDVEATLRHSFEIRYVLAGQVRSRDALLVAR